MTTEKVNGYANSQVPWVYVPGKDYGARVVVYEIVPRTDDKDGEWHLLFGDTLYKGSFQEIFRQCVDIVVAADKKKAS